MTNFARNYPVFILSDREWSWTVIGAVYLAATLFVRLIVFRKIVQETKQIDPNLYSSVRSLYLKHSLGGWILFTISFILVTTVWLGRIGLHSDPILLILFCLTLPTLFFMSIILHIRAFSKALLTVLRHRMGMEKEF